MNMQGTIDSSASMFANRYPFEDALKPVSYTHLDVYKRQFHFSAISYQHINTSAHQHINKFSSLISNLSLLTVYRSPFTVYFSLISSLTSHLSPLLSQKFTQRRKDSLLSNLQSAISHQLSAIKTSTHQQIILYNF